MNSEFHQKVPMFIKIVLEDTIKERRLEIPSEFVTEFGNSLRNPIILEVPNGKTWKVKMTKIGEKFWLGKGWIPFSEHYSLKKGHLLVFKYEGNSHFNVLLFDMTAVEIDYPGTSSDNQSQPKMNKNKEISTLISDPDIQEFGGNLASSSEVDPNATNSSTPTNPWFKITVKNIPQLAVPFRFIKTHMGCEMKTIMLKVGDKAWLVKLHVYLSNKNAQLHSGVSSFIKDNSLKEGDVCLFELISNDAFNVSISRI